MFRTRGQLFVVAKAITVSMSRAFNLERSIVASCPMLVVLVSEHVLYLPAGTVGTAALRRPKAGAGRGVGNRPSPLGRAHYSSPALFLLRVSGDIALSD